MEIKIGRLSGAGEKLVPYRIAGSPYAFPQFFCDLEYTTIPLITTIDN